MNYVLVHGGDISANDFAALCGITTHDDSASLLGGHVWSRVATALIACGHCVYTPTLGDPSEYSLLDHVRQVKNLLEEHSLEQVVLVGHSYGGMVITGVAAQVPSKVRSLCYVDAALPDPDQSLFELLELSGMDPLSIIPDKPLAYLQGIHFSTTVIQSIPQYYVICAKSKFLATVSHAKQQQAYAQPVREWMLPTGHVPMATMPEELAVCLQACSGD